ncbi:MAG TPA: hypothetical protein VFP87_00720 [Chitinophagaceae bacterium]|nr:hypothetical protein [Chitinophagaceae bacterium]
MEYGFSHVTLQGDLGICHAALGDMDKAFNYLNEAYEKHIATIFYPLRYPHYKLLNEDERYWQLLEKMGLKKYYEKDRNRDT